MSDNDHEMIDPGLIEAASAGCEESRILLNRRALMGLSAGLFTWACLPRHAEAFADDQRLLIVLLRGGLDGLHVAYHGDEKQALLAARSTIYSENYLSSYPELVYRRGEDVVPSGYRINKTLENFRSWYELGQASLVHAIAPPLRTRSHFDCMDNVENGQFGLSNRTKDGWLSRFLAGLHSSENARALSVGGAPLILHGEALVDTWSPKIMAGIGGQGTGFASSISQIYNEGDALFSTISRNLQRSIATDSSIAGLPRESGLVSSFKAAASLMARTNGPRVAVLSIDGLDTHSGQIAVLDRRLSDLDSGLKAFKDTLDGGNRNAWSKTVVLCVTEFGRSVRPNAAMQSTGTDHGTGTVALLMGGNVMGGKVRGNWPGLSQLLDNRDLMATTDLRSIFKGVLRDHMGLQDENFMNNIVFPNSGEKVPIKYAPTTAGLIRNPARVALRLKA